MLFQDLILYLKHMQAVGKKMFIDVWAYLFAMNSILCSQKITFFSIFGKFIFHCTSTDTVHPP